MKRLGSSVMLTFLVLLASTEAATAANKLLVRQRRQFSNNFDNFDYFDNSDRDQTPINAGSRPLQRPDFFYPNDDTFPQSDLEDRQQQQQQFQRQPQGQQFQRRPQQQQQQFQRQPERQQFQRQPQRQQFQRQPGQQQQQQFQQQFQRQPQQQQQFQRQPERQQFQRQPQRQQQPGNELIFTSNRENNTSITTTRRPSNSRRTTNAPTTTTRSPQVVFINNRPTVATVPPFRTATTESPQFLDCFNRCQTTSEYNPICGSNMQLYFNEQKFNCAQRCGADVQIVRRGSCQGLFPMMRG